jgi:transposase-like protein
MSKPIFSEPHFNDEDAARRHLEAIRWPNGPVCPHCGVINHAYATKRPGKYRCAEPACRKDFTATVGTLFERSKIPLTTWFRAVHLLTSSKKGMSTHQVHRMLGVSVKTAWFMMHRIREGMRIGKLALMGSGGGTVEADETFIGREPGMPKKRAYHHKMKVLSLVDRRTGEARSVVVDDLKPETIVPILAENIAREARVMTDEAGHYHHLRKQFAEHNVVRHGAEEYVLLEDRTIHTNTMEGYFSIFKRGMKGVYQHCGKKHLHRYLAEFDFRYSNRSARGVEDRERARKVIENIGGKRLTYGGTHPQEAIP